MDLPPHDAYMREKLNGREPEDKNELTELVVGSHSDLPSDG